MNCKKSLTAQQNFLDFFDFQEEL